MIGTRVTPDRMKQSYNQRDFIEAVFLLGQIQIEMIEELRACLVSGRICRVQKTMCFHYASQTLINRVPGAFW